MYDKSKILWDNFYLAGDHKRLFINTSIGCFSSCSYCYLPFFGFEIGKSPMNRLSHKKIISELNDNFKKGKHGTIMSLGCFSDCWDRFNRKESKELIRYFLQQGNPVQLATKQYVNWKDIITFKKLVRWKGQLTIFISCSTITFWKIYEKGTISPQKRFQSFEIVKILDIPTFLYIKPVLKHVTILDVDNFSQIMKKYDVNAIVGSAFSKENISKEKAPIGKANLFYNRIVEENMIKKILRKVGKVYTYSVEPINEWRRK